MTEETTDLRQHAQELGIETEGKSDLEVAREVAEKESSSKARSQADEPAGRTDREVAGDLSRPSTRGAGAEGSRVGKLDADDPAAGTIDDPNVEDPYAHLRGREEALQEASDARREGDEDDL